MFGSYGQGNRRSHCGIDYHTTSPDLVLMPVGSHNSHVIGSPDGQIGLPDNHTRELHSQVVIPRPLSLGSGGNTPPTAYFYSLHSR